MGSRLNYLDTHSSGQHGQIHGCTHTQTLTHALLLGVRPRLPHSSSECLSSTSLLRLSQTIFVFLIPSRFLPSSHLEFSLATTTIAVSSLCCGSLSIQ